MSENLLSTHCAGIAVALSCLTSGRFGIGAAGVGVAEAAVDLAVHGLCTRRLLGGPPGGCNTGKFNMAERETEIDCARSI